MKKTYSIDAFALQRVFQFIGLIGLIVGAVFFLAKGIVDNNIRIIICVLLTFILGVFCLRITTGVVAILIFLPFMAFIRRFIYSFEPYAELDPILLISSILTLFMFSYLFVFEGEELIRLAKTNKLLKYINYLLVLFILQIFNPLQSGLAMGFTGVIYWIVPLLWFYFGFFITKEKLEVIFYITIITGIISALYGIRQIYYGFLPFEKYWIELNRLTALNVGGFIKAFSIFTSPQEYSHYLMIAAAVSFTHILKKPYLSLLFLLTLLIILYGVFMCSTRGVIFLFLIYIGIFICLRLMDFKKALFVNLLFVSIVIYAISIIPMPSEEVPVTSAKQANFAHMAKGVKQPFSEESTFWNHAGQIKWALMELSSAPLGLGLGSATLAGTKFGGKMSGGTGESFHFSIISSFGVVGILLYLLVIYWIIKMAISLVMKAPNTYLLPSSLAIWFTFAVEPRLYSTGPFIYLIWGWIAKEWQYYNE